MKMQSIYVFVKLAESNCDFNIHKVVGIPRSSMWTYISDLEKTLGRKLINRKKQGVSFTAAGKDFIPYAYRIYQTYEESLVNKSTVEDSAIEGDILVSTTNAVALQWSMDSIKKLYAEYPNVRMHISASDIISREEENVYDVLIRPFNESENYKKIWYTVYHHGLFASQKYLDKMGMPTSPEALTSHRMIGYGEHTYSYFEDINWHLRGQGYGLPKLKPILTINSTKAIFEAAKTGLGICSAPIESNAYYNSNLIRVLPEINGPIIKSFFCIKKNATGRKLKCISTFNTYYVEYLKTLGVHIILLENIV